MSIFFGSNADETITPELVSPSVVVIGTPKQPSAAVDLIFAGGGNDTVAGGGGDDLAFLGAGDDTFIWRPGDGSDFVDGGAGTDRLAFDGSAAAENITVSGNGLAQVARDVGNVTMNLNRDRADRDCGARRPGPDHGERSRAHGREGRCRRSRWRSKPECRRWPGGYGHRQRRPGGRADQRGSAGKHRGRQRAFCHDDHRARRCGRRPARRSTAGVATTGSMPLLSRRVPCCSRWTGARATTR